MGDSNQVNKDKRTRDKRAEYDEEIRAVLKIILELAETKWKNRKWDTRKALASQAKEKLSEPQFYLKKLTSIIMECRSSGHNTEVAELALQNLKSFFDQLKNTVVNQSFTIGIHKPSLYIIPSNENGGLYIKDDGSREETRKPSDSELTIGGRETGRVEPQKITNQERGSLVADSTDDLDLDILLEDFAMPERLPDDMYYGEDGAGTSNAAANEANVKLPPNETYILSYKDNAKAVNWDDGTGILLKEILQEHPNITEYFKFTSPEIQNPIMNLLAKIYQKAVKSNQEMLESGDILSMEVMVRDMEIAGLQVTWLKEKLAEIRERLERQEANRKLLKRIRSNAETEDFAMPERLLDDMYYGEDGAVVKAVNWDEGTSNAAANEANVKLPPNETYILCCKDNAKAVNWDDGTGILLNEILQEHPNIIEYFIVTSPEIQNQILNLLAKIYQKAVKNNQEMLERGDILSMEVMVRDMEIAGLQVTWLKEKLAEIRERLERQEANRKLLKRIRSDAESEAPEQELAQSAKKPRFQ